MQIVEDCYAGCGNEVPFTTAAERGSDELIDGVSVSCPECGHRYTLTVDGDGEADLQDTGDAEQVIDDPDATHY
jgi:DNA-directed RNA polymerase subunit RPC12/RpoP